MRASAVAILLAGACGGALAQVPAPSERTGPPASQAPLIAAFPEGAGAGSARALLSEQGEGELLSSDLVGRFLYDRGGRKLGEVRDMLVDRNRRLSALVVALDTGPGTQARSVGIPFEALRRASVGQEIRLVVDIDEARLKEAKAFEPLSKEAGQDDNQDLTAKGATATGGSVPPTR